MSKELEALETMYSESDYRGVNIDYNTIKSALERLERYETLNKCIRKIVDIIIEGTI